MKTTELKTIRQISMKERNIIDRRESYHEDDKMVIINMFDMANFFVKNEEIQIWLSDIGRKEFYNAIWTTFPTNNIIIEEFKSASIAHAICDNIHKHLPLGSYLWLDRLFHLFFQYLEDRWNNKEAEK